MDTRGFEILPPTRWIWLETIEFENVFTFVRPLRDDKLNVGQEEFQQEWRTKKFKYYVSAYEIKI